MNSTVTIQTFGELIQQYNFVIPAYQRAYSWTEKQTVLFIGDLVEHAGKTTKYYLGHYILEEDKDGQFAIIDGQQRLTTIALFLAVCQFLTKSSTPIPSLRLNVAEYDNARFQEICLSENLAALVNQERKQKERTASLDRVVKTIQTFYQSFQTGKQQNKPELLCVAKIDDYIDVIRKAAVSVGIHKDKAVAAQIFELTNTRGVPLTETEKVKALLMKYVYLNSTDGNRDVGDIQRFFAKVFELEEESAKASFRGEMSLDDILAHHLRAVDDGKDEPVFTQPQNVEGEHGCLEYVRQKLNSFDADKPSGIQYAKDIAREFAASMALISNRFVVQDKKEPLIGDVILLDQRRSMIFLLRYFRALPDEQSADQLLLKRWESFLFLWNWHDAFYNMKSARKDSFPDIFKLIRKDYTQVAGLLGKYYRNKESFAYWPFQTKRTENNVVTEINGLEGVFRDYITRLNDDLLLRAYNRGNWHFRYKYWLYKYEIESEKTKGGTDQSDQVRSFLRTLFKDDAVTLDHIIPHGLGWNELSVSGEHQSDIRLWKDEADKRQAEATWQGIHEIINGIGNLVLLSHSDNASLQNIAPFNRADAYRKLNLKGASYREVEAWKASIEWRTRIEARGELLIKWMQDYFTAKPTWTDKETE
jgi:hypothetical protein